MSENDLEKLRLHPLFTVEQYENIWRDFTEKYPDLYMEIAAYGGGDPDALGRFVSYLQLYVVQNLSSEIKDYVGVEDNHPDAWKRSLVANKIVGSIMTVARRFASVNGFDHI